MCNLDKLCVVKKRLTFPQLHNLMWLEVWKIVDRLYTKNNKNPDLK